MPFVVAVSGMATSPTSLMTSPFNSDPEPLPLGSFPEQAIIAKHIAPKQKTPTDHECLTMRHLLDFARIQWDRFYGYLPNTRTLDSLQAKVRDGSHVPCVELRNFLL